MTWVASLAVATVAVHWQVSAANSQQQASCLQSESWFQGCTADEVVRAMSSAEPDAEVQGRGSYALGFMVFDTDHAVDVERQRSVAASGAIVAVLRAMALFPEDAEVQSNGCYALGFLVSDVTTAEGLIGPVVAAMSRLPGDAGVQSNGAYALGALTPENGQTVAMAGGAEATIQAMANFPDDAGVQSNGCFALGGLALESDYARRRVVEAGGVQAVAAAMELFPAEEQVQSACKHRCTLPDLPPLPPLPPLDQQSNSTADVGATLANAPALNSCEDVPISLTWTMATGLSPANTPAAAAAR